MDLIKLAIRRPTAIMAAVLMVIAVGLVALANIPIQLTPDVRRPVLHIGTSWLGAAPAEVEREITNRIEAQLNGIEGVESLTSQSYFNYSSISVSFGVEHNMERAFMIVSNRLNRVTGLPDEAFKPRIRTSSSDDEPIARLALVRLPGNERGIETFGTEVSQLIVDPLERVSGVSQVHRAGGAARELQVEVEPQRLARYGLTVPQVVQALRGANFSVTAGAVDEGKRSYSVRVESESSTIDRVRDVVLRTHVDEASGQVVSATVGDIAQVQFGYKEPTSRRRFNGEPMIRLNVIRDAGANVIETMKGVREAVAELNEEVLPDHRLKLTLFYDETLYIGSAIDLVQQNIYVGGTLAILILLLFLRSLRATLVVSLAVPASVIGAFVAMAVVGRSVNVISLAGIAFAVGMVVDAAIVVLENIFRHRQRGLAAEQAAHRGARQVWSAVLASALTTVVVFLPLLALKIEVGQLFRDIAVAISVSVLLSLLVAVTVIPALSRFLLKGGALDKGRRLRLPLIDWLAALFVRGILGLIGATIRHRAACVAVILLVCGTAAASTYWFLPKLDFLPDGNQNFVLGRIQPPPGYNLRNTFRLAEDIESALKPAWKSVSGPESAPGEPPKIDNFFFISYKNFALIGASSVELERAGELVPVMRKPLFREPGTRGFVNQRSIFSRRIGGSRVIHLNIIGSDLNVLLDVARKADDMLARVLPARDGHQVRPRPGLHLAAPEIRITPDLRRLANVGLTARDFGQTIDVLNEGMKVSEINVGSWRMDLTLRSPRSEVKSTQGIGHLPVVIPSGEIVPAESLADIEITSGPTEIRHIERARAITLLVRPAKDMPLETAIELIEREVATPLRQAGLPPESRIKFSGAAGSLERTWNAMKLNLLLALVIVYLVMAVLFENFLYPLIILLSVPLATAGGVGGLALLNLFVTQPLDMLTMLGFVILIGIVVNNAILLVDQTLQHVRLEGQAPVEAILAAAGNRMRPIFMSTLTSIFGLLPLVLFPGAGSELYRGLGSVVVGGLCLSALLTLTIIPPLLALLLGRRSPRAASLIEKSQQAAD